MDSTGYRVSKSEVDAIICHRKIGKNERYLVRWKCHDESCAVLSWHPLTELTSVILLLQQYIAKFLTSLNENGDALHAPLKDLNLQSRKRKSPHDENSSPAPSPSTGTPGDTSANPRRREVMNGRLSFNSGDIYPARHSRNIANEIDATTMPTQDMIRDAAALNTKGVRDARICIGNEFKSLLTSLPGPPVTLINQVDKDVPSLNFDWISDYVLGEGVTKLDKEAIVGCQKCRPDMGQNIGCEYTRKCGCLEYAVPDYTRCKNDEERKRYDAWQRKEGDASDLPKRFPYMVGSGLLNEFYLQSRFVVYECNESCRCGSGCKNKVVQWGRKVPLEIFKTKHRGFGLRCPKLLSKGQFIDKYLGELITDAEADRREKASGPGRASYLFWLDKHADDDDPNSPDYSECYVADGERMGGPTRFINHSCDPNCRLFTVSYNKYDQKVYDLAFFALRNIPAGEELTFDYVDPEEGEAGKAQEVTEKTQGKEVPECLCGADNCRGKMWG